MISSQDLFPIGYVSKTHGTKGELNVKLDTVYNPEDFKFLIFNLDDTFIPFKTISSRGNNDSSRLVLLDNINNIDEARDFVGKTVYVLEKEIHNHPLYNDENQEDGIYLSDLIGYKVVLNSAKSGVITNFNDETQNYLLEIELGADNKILIPYVEDWLVEIDTENKTIEFEVPEDLLTNN